MTVAAPKVELLLNGTWTDVTADVDFNTGYQIHVGRTNAQSQPSAGTCTVTFRNPTGKYTPGLQVLSDGTAAPFYPYLDVQISIRISTTAGVEFVGDVTGFAPTVVNGFAGYCVISGEDMMTRLSRVVMLAPIAQEIAIDGAVAYWPFTDSAGALTVSGSVDGLLAPMTINHVGTVSSTNTLTFGAGLVTPDGQLPLAASNTAGSQGGYYFTGPSALLAATAGAAAFTIECCVEINDTSQEQVVWAFGSGLSVIVQAGTSTPQFVGIIGNPMAGGGLTHLVLTFSGGVTTLYQDGVNIGSTNVILTAPSLAQLTVGADPIHLSTAWSGSIGHFAIYTTALSATRVAVHYNAALAWSPETAQARIIRYLSYGGITGISGSIDNIKALLLDSYPQAGKDIVTACQDVVTTAAGAAVFYILAGVPQFRDRFYNANGPGHIAFTVDAVLDMDRGTYSPSLDSQTLINSATVVSANLYLDSIRQATATDATSVAKYGLFTGSPVTSYELAESAPANMAQYLVAANRTPMLRLPQVSVDLLTSATGLVPIGIGIGVPFLVTSIPSGASGATQLLVTLQGWTITRNQNTYLWVADVTGADNPADLVWANIATLGSATAPYQRWAAAPDCALNASLTAAATTVVIKCPTLPTFTTSAASHVYPMTIKVEGEHIQLTAPPGGSTSPQTFTGCVRAVDGTHASAHPSGATVQLTPAPTWTLGAFL